MEPMKQCFRLSGLFIGLLLAFASIGVTLAQQAPTPVPLTAPPGPVTRHATRFDVVDAPEQFNRVLLVIDFPGGAWTPSHTPGGNLYLSVIDGEISTRSAAETELEQTYAAGTSFTVAPGEYVELGNASAAPARVVATALLAKGAPLTIDAAGFSRDVYSGPTDAYFLADSGAHPPSPRVIHHSSIEVERPAGAFELVHLVLDFDPGVWTPQHLHGGQELVTLTAGELVLHRRGETQVFAAGDSWLNPSGLVHAAGNDGASFAQAVATFLLPAGRPLTTVV
jgi:quercetin dioxygenase-like cupin family protein